LLGDGHGRRSANRLSVTAHSGGDGAPVLLARGEPNRVLERAVIAAATASAPARRGRYPAPAPRAGRATCTRGAGSCGRAAVCAGVPYARPMAQLVEARRAVATEACQNRRSRLPSPDGRHGLACRLAAVALVRDQWRRAAPTPGSRHSIPRRRSRASRRRDRARAGSDASPTLAGSPGGHEGHKQGTGLVRGRGARVEERLPRPA